MSDVGEQTAATPPESDTAVLGSTAAVRETEGEHDHGMIAGITVGVPPEWAAASSLVRALLGRRHGELFQVQTPEGMRLLTIMEIADEAEL